MSNIPKLRFPEFKGEWEEKKLSDIASFSKGKGYTKNDLVNDGSPIILYGRMYTKYETVISDIDTFVNLQEGSIISKGGEIIVPASGETAEEISRASVVKNKGIILGGDLNIKKKKKDKYNPEFFALTISSGTSQKRLSKLAQGKSVVHLHNEDLSGLQIKVPSLAEQQKIADFLSNVDSIITAETKILNTLQKKKKALMQKLFTQQLRFKSDNGKDFPAWEESTLEKECDYVDYRGKTPKKVSTGIFLVTAKNIKLGYIDYECSKEYIAENDYNEVMHRGKVKLGDVLITTEAPCGNVAQIDNENVALAQRVIKYSSKGRLNNTFLKYYFLSDLFRTIINEKATGSTVKGIKGSVLHKQKVIVPSLEEQQKIADCLSSLDSLIQTQQKVVTTWQQRKKALLQQMFI